MRIRRPDATECWVLLTANVAKDENGLPVLRITVADVDKLVLTQQELRRTLHEKEALLKEVHHRVKNNLQVVASLLRLESGRTSQPGTKVVLDDMQGRITSMALVHEALYKSDSFSSVDLGAYLRELATQLFRSQRTTWARTRLQLELASARVRMDQAIPCGLLVNELLSNCLKHGFPDGQEGEIAVSLQPTGEGRRWALTVSDTGVGLPPDFEARRRESLGLQLAVDLADQLGGTLEISQPSGLQQGVTFSVVIELKDAVHMDEVG